MQNLERSLSRQSEQDKTKNKTRVRELEQENEELKKMLKQKELIQMSIDEEWNEKIKNLKETFSLEKRSIIAECEDRLH